MPPIEPDLDPWDDTHEERGEEMDDPYLTSADNPFGASPELIGVPGWNRGIRRGTPITRSSVTRAILFVLLAAVVITVVYGTLRVII